MVTLGLQACSDQAFSGSKFLPLTSHVTTLAKVRVVRKR